MLNRTAPANFRGLDPDLPITVYHRQLPHWRQEGATYFVTFRLADALPQAKLFELQDLRSQWEAAHPAPRTNEDWQAYCREVRGKAETWLDEGYGKCYFQDPQLAQLLTRSLVYFQNVRAFTSCYAVMPNHCHVIVRPLGTFALDTILKSWKGYVARQVNRALGRTGVLWQDESYDCIIRDQEHLYDVIQYIGRNPGSAGIDEAGWVRWVAPEWEQAGWGFRTQ